MKPELRPFYMSPAWRSTRESYMKKVSGLCEMCSKLGLVTPAEIVHHIVPVTIENVHDKSITLSFDNLMALCRKHHAEVHSDRKHRYLVDEMGRVKGLDD